MTIGRVIISLFVTFAVASAVVLPAVYPSKPSVPLLSPTSRQATSTVPYKYGGFCEPIAELTEKLKVYKSAMKDKKVDGMKAISDSGAEDLAHYYEALAKARKDKIKMEKEEAKQLEKLEKEKEKDLEKLAKEDEKAAKQLAKEEEERLKQLAKEEDERLKQLTKEEEERQKQLAKEQEEAEKNGVTTALVTRQEEVIDQDDDEYVLCYTPELLELYYKVLVPNHDPAVTFPGQGDFLGAHDFIRPKQFEAGASGAVARSSLLPGVLRSTYAPCTQYYSCIYVDCYCCLHGWLGSGRRGFEYCADSIDVPSLNSNTVRDRECKVAFIKWWVISEPGGLEVERPCFYASRCDAWLWENTMDDLKDPRKCLCDSSPYKGMPGFSGACVKQSTDLVMSFEPQS
eukprot:CAMPEP_0174913160 /NCGR_PEP_ID=MMETSP0167-20121228/80175_1 /TAXON_ID=38298 /ORGANISM="Rhodella maculata, Strain CCMP736" /LENGTH=399 /DNA_ID=CAMNT_0016157869 /DNA_START=6 /DNA_END=1205 /DNA_ORIENTATION=-